MEELFDNIFVLVPIALIIFLRVFSEGARKRAEKAKKPAAAATSPVPSAPTGQSVPIRPEPQGKARQARAAKGDILGRLRAYLSGSLEQPVQRMEPLHFEEEATRRLGQFKAQSAGLPSTKPPVTSGYREGLPGAMEESAAITREPVAAYTIPVRLERLPPLKRAIVLSEILGKPKSMQ